jgi:hexosaminidase
MLQLKQLCLVLLAGLFPSAVLALWPMPRSLSTGNTAVKLAPMFDIAVDITNPPDDLVEAMQRTKHQLTNDRLQPLVVGRGVANHSAIVKAGELLVLSLSLSSSHGGAGDTPALTIAEEAVKPLLERDESYTLMVPTNDSMATITANTTLGLLRGLTTFNQLWYEQEGTTYTLEAPIEITDRPAFVSWLV